MVLLPFLPEDVLEDALADADVPTLRALKGVSKAWRARARRVLCARLCARFGLPLTSILVEVTTLDLSGSRDAGRLFADAADAACGLPNLARVTGLGGFEVDVAKLNDVMPSFMYPIGHPPKWPMTEVRACIEGEGVAPAPMEVLFAAFALRTGEAVVPACVFRGDTSMTSIELPAGLMSIGEYAFKGCSSLTSIKVTPVRCSPSTTPRPTRRRWRSRSRCTSSCPRTRFILVASCPSLLALLSAVACTTLSVLTR